MTAAKRKETPAQADGKTVADEGAAPDENQAVAEEKASVVAEPAKAADAPVDVPTAAVEPNEDKGVCDNHPDRPAVLVTGFPWVTQQRFCQRCVPEQYRYLL